jgi:glutathione S-transferase
MTDILYGAPLSLYSGKARSYLDWKGVDYREVLPTPDVMKGVIIPNVGRPVMPVVETAEGMIIQDTTCIIDHFEAKADGPSVYPDTPIQKLVALLFELYGDEWLVIPAMHYRWHYNEDWVYGEFGKVALPDGTPEEQHEKGKENGSRFKGFVPLLGITPETIPGVEASYEALLGELDVHFSAHNYLLGTRPSIGDYGLIGPLYAHLYRDPESGKLMKRLAPNVARWVERMMHVEAPRSGEFLPNDAIPDTLLPVLTRIMDEHIPHLQAVASTYADWAEANPGAEVPRGVGMVEFSIGGTTGQRVAMTFNLWMLQRPLDFYRSLAGDAKTAADALLAQVGGAAFIDFDLRCRVRFENHILSQG